MSRFEKIENLTVGDNTAELGVIHEMHPDTTSCGLTVFVLYTDRGEVIVEAGGTVQVLEDE